MEEQKFSFGGSFRKTKEYIDSQLELIKLRAVAKIGRIVGAIVVSIIKFLFFGLVLFFLALALGFYLSSLVDSFALGFLITGGIFLLLAITLSLAKNILKAMFVNMVIRNFLSNWHQDDDYLEQNRAERAKRKAEQAVKEKEAAEAMNEVENNVNKTDEHK